MKAPLVRIIGAVLALALVVGGVWAYRGAQARQREEALAAAATALAKALKAGDVPAGLIDGAPDVKALLAQASDVPHTVEVAATTMDGDSATARLHHGWTLQPGAPTYGYDVTAKLTRRDDRWVATWSPDLLAPGAQAGDLLRTVRRTAARAEVLGQGDQPLVTARPVVFVGIDRSLVAKDVAVASAARLAQAMEVDVQPYVDAVAGAGEKAFVRAITVRDPSPELVSAQALSLPGLLLVKDEIPLAPTPTFARPVLGRVGDATAELVAKSGGRIQAGDQTGLSGLQASYDETLAGRPGQVLQVVPTTGAARDLHTVPPKPGAPVRTTLDVRVQTAADATLAAVKPASALVAIRPSDGQVLAVASGPGGEGVSTATLGQYAPGSTFKAVSAMALLRAGLTPSSSVDCPATLVVDGRTFKNYTGYPTSKLGAIPLRTAFAQSCNTAFMGQRGKLSDAALAEAAAGLGLGGDPALGVPATFGAVPTNNGDTDKAASMIGQGRVQASPLGMATVAASIAAGRPVTPVLVREPAPKAPTPPAKPVTAAEASALRELMRAVVTEGNSAFLAGTPGGEIAAKSGTAEYGDATPPRTHAWMIAIQGDLAVACFVADGTGGAADAGPLVKSFLTRLAG